MYQQTTLNHVVPDRVAQSVGHLTRLGGLSLPRKSVVRLTDRPDMTLDVYRGR